MKNLLIIDDEKLLVENMEFILKPYASRIFTGYNGKEGLEILEKENIHCVICDISMPVMSGVEFIKEVRRRGIDVPVVFYSAFGNHELMMEVAKYGAFDFLSKPDFRDVETVIMRGLAEGFRKNEKTERSDEYFISEYQKLLEKIETHHGEE